MAFRPPPTGGSSLTVRSAALRWLVRERRAIDEHPMHDDSEFASQRYRGFLQPSPLGDAYPPALQGGAAFERPAQDDVSGLVEHRTHRPVPML
jgi:hypothetical protein